MSCRSLDQVYLLDSARFSAEERVALEAHAAGCSECSAVLARLRSARGVILSQSTAVPADARVAIWAKLEPEERSYLGPRAIAALGAFAVAAVVALVFLRPGAPEEASEQPVVAAVEGAAEEQGRDFFAGRIYAQPGAIWRIEERAIILESGELEVDVLAAEAVEVVTDETIVRLLGSRAHIARVARGVEIRANRGTASVRPKDGFAARSLDEGKTVLVARAEVSAKNFAPTEEAARSAKNFAPGEEAARSAKNFAPREEAARSAKNFAPGEPAPEADPVTELQTAREVIDRDPPRAAEIAERVLERKPSAELHAQALAVLADAQRRRGLLLEAARSYERLRDHPNGRGYAEEAMLQRALLYVELKDYTSALTELSRLEQQHPRGVSAPERAALAAKIYLHRDDPRAAARALLDAKFDGRSRAFELRKSEVIEALQAIDPALADQLKK